MARHYQRASLNGKTTSVKEGQKEATADPKARRPVSGAMYVHNSNKKTKWLTEE